MKWPWLRTALAPLRRLSPHADRLVRESHRQVVALRHRGDLVALADYYGTDKWNHHWYAELYADHFHHLRARPINLLEIGIGGYDDPRSGGASLRMWKAYFARGQVYGIDIHDKRLVEERRIHVFRGSQADLEFMSDVFARIGSVDIVIDDGSHVNADALATFQHCFPLLANGGIYAIEDVQTSYWPEYGGHPGGACDPKTVMGFFKAQTDGLNRTEIKGDGRDWGYVGTHLKAVHFYHNLIIVEKGDSTAPRRPGLRA